MDCNKQRNKKFQSDIKPINIPITGRQFCSPKSPVSCFDISPSQVNDSSADLEITKQPSIAISSPPQYLLFSIQLCLQYPASRLREAGISAIPPETDGQTPLITMLMIFCSELEFSPECSAVGGGDWKYFKSRLPGADLQHLFTFHKDLINICCDCSGHHW